MTELLTKLNPKVSQIDTVGHSTAEQLTSADIAAACCDLDQVTAALLMAHIAGDDNELKRLLRPTFTLRNGKMENTGGLFSPIFRETLKLASDRHWRVVKRGEDRLRVLTRIAIERVVMAPVCRTCLGTKYIESVQCGGCGGSGQRRFDAREVAKELGVAESTYSEHYRYKYNDVVTMIETMIHKGKGKICL